MQTKKMNLSRIISLEVGENELVKRLLNRGLDSGREDDRNETVIRNRIQVYEKQTSILKTYYLEKFNDLFFSIDGERSVDEIAADIKKIIL